MDLIRDTAVNTQHAPAFIVPGHSLKRRFMLLSGLLTIVILGVDLALRNAQRSTIVTGVLDETGHFATIVLAILVGEAWRHRWLAAGMVLGSTTIDLDHIPALLGSQVITTGTDRPYTHTPMMIIVVGLLAFRLRQPARATAFGFSIGLLIHLWRDLAVNAGVALLWPLSTHDIEMPYVVYFLSMIVMAIAIVANAYRSRRAFSVASSSDR